MAVSTRLQGILKKMGQGLILVPYIHRFLSTKADFSWESRLAPKPGDDYFHPSSDMDACIRMLYYLRSETYLHVFPDEIIEPRTQLIFDMGNMVHDWFQAMLFAMSELPNYPRLLEAEVGVFSEEWWVVGHADGVMEWPDGTKRLLEIKTANEQSFMSTKSPKSEWVYQTNMYMELLELDEAVVLVLNKNTCELKEFIVKKDPELVREIRSRLDGARAAVALDEKPERPYGKPGPKCRWCRCVQVCWGEDD